MNSHRSARAARAINLEFFKSPLCLLIGISCIVCLTNQQQFPFPGSFPTFLQSRLNPSLAKNSRWLPPGQQLVFSRNEDNVERAGSETTASPMGTTSNPVFVNNVPVIPTLAPFLPTVTTASPQHLECIRQCPTTSEYNPICASNRQMYGNEQKFNCARNCGADIQIVRRGSCEGLVQMTKG
ncbi:uncharacterized protein LOC106093172 [Stomoxys calcitrans]|uniref:Kazal-like domain-containing protein n=1 Tax=Stomoxys calcitrans TaxID=35570 RepID=A0A1I8PI75_STOCA|nr:uncharacterized protein LOC106093172 [Stomoxys calcitrans]